MTIPPLHPRYRCAIAYEETGAPRVNQPKPPKPEFKPETKPTPVINPLLIPMTVPVVSPVVSPKPVPNNPEPTKEPESDDQFVFDIQRFGVKEDLQTAMRENRIKGELMYPPPKEDFSNFTFDAEHTQGDKHPHNVTEEEARKFIDDAYFAIVKYNGNSYNYYGKEGATFARLDLKTLRTAFKSEEYDGNIKKLIEVYENGVK